MHSIRRRLDLLALLLFEGIALAVLHRLGRVDWLRIPWSELGPWLESAPIEDALAAVLRHVGLIVAYWMLATTVGYLAIRLSRLPVALRSIDWATAPFVRRIVDGAVAVSVATASIAAPIAPAFADDPPPVVVETDERGRPVPPRIPEVAGSEDAVVVDTDSPPRPAGLRRIGWTPTPAEIPPEPALPGGDAARPLHDRIRTRTFVDAPLAGSIIVQAGDHLWSISHRHLEHTRDGAASTDSIAQYWREVVDANRDRLQSGDPDLIYPGETVLLPPVTTEDQ